MHFYCKHDGNWYTFARGTKAAAAVEDGIVRMWDVLWNGDEGRFEEAAMKDSVRAHQVHVNNQISVSVLSLTLSYSLNFPNLLAAVSSGGRFTNSALSFMLSLSA